MLAKGLGDANAAAQDAALEALQAYLAISDEAQAAECVTSECTAAAWHMHFRNPSRVWNVDS